MILNHTPFDFLTFYLFLTLPKWSLKTHFCCNNKPAKVFYPAIDHFVNKTAQSPPIHSIGIPVVSNHFGCLKGKFRIKYPPSETHISNSPDTPRDWLVVFEFNGKTKVRNSAMSFSEKYTHSYKK